MRAGGGHAKGADWERAVCKKLSLFLTKGQRDDVLWRTAMSGGRATLQLKKDVLNRAQAGDIGAIAREGYDLCERCYIEAKSYKSLEIPQLVTKNSGLLAGFWKSTAAAAQRLDKIPILIAKQNQFPALLLCPPRCSIFKGTPIATLHLLPAAVYVFDEAVYTIRRRRAA